MSSNQTDQETRHIDRGAILSSSDQSSCDQSHLRGLIRSQSGLVSTLELLWSYQAVLQADVNFARLFDIPLSSALKLQGLESLFRHNLNVIEKHHSESVILWVDVVLSSTYESEQQSDGSYQIRVDKGKVLVSKEDHEFIMTGLPRQLVNPRSYPCDVASEINAVRLTHSQIAPWMDLASECL